MTPTQRAAAERLADAVMHPEAAALLRELAAEPVQAPDLVRDFPAVKAAKKAAEAELGYYRMLRTSTRNQQPCARATRCRSTPHRSSLCAAPRTEASAGRAGTAGLSRSSANRSVMR